MQGFILRQSLVYKTYKNEWVIIGPETRLEAILPCRDKVEDCGPLLSYIYLSTECLDEDI